MLKNNESNKVATQIIGKNKIGLKKKINKDIYNDLNEISFQLSLERLNAYYMIKEAPNKKEEETKPQHKHLFFFYNH